MALRADIVEQNGAQRSFRAVMKDGKVVIGNERSLSRRIRRDHRLYIVRQHRPPENARVMGSSSAVPVGLSGIELYPRRARGIPHLRIERGKRQSLAQRQFQIGGIVGA